MRNNSKEIRLSDRVKAITHGFDLVGFRCVGEEFSFANIYRQELYACAVIFLGLMRTAHYFALLVLIAAYVLSVPDNPFLSVDE